MNGVLLEGFSSDGAASNRNASYNMFFVDKDEDFKTVFKSESASKETKLFAKEAWDLFLSASLLVVFPLIVGDNMLTFFVDFVHLMWRLRTPMLGWDSCLKIGKAFDINVHLLWLNFKDNTKEIINVTTTDLDYHNK